MTDWKDDLAEGLPPECRETAERVAEAVHHGAERGKLMREHLVPPAEAQTSPEDGVQCPYCEGRFALGEALEYLTATEAVDEHRYCWTCRFWKEGDPGECRRHPPVMFASWPQTDEKHWCGEWESN